MQNIILIIQIELKEETIYHSFKLANVNKIPIRIFIPKKQSLNLPPE